jgi:hypothetical protein
VLYFAYGSNMDWAQMRDRCRSSRFVGIAVLPDHRLAFTRKSLNRSCGVADAVRDIGRKLWGVVYEISDLDIGRLDQAEGYRPGRETNSYWRRKCMIFLDGDEAQPLTVSTYFGDAQPNPPLPSQTYKDLLISGARHWHLPGAYIKELQNIRVDG